MKQNNFKCIKCNNIIKKHNIKKILSVKLRQCVCLWCEN